MLKYIVGIAVFMHGVGHAAGILSAWTLVESGFTDRPWIFSQGVTMSSPLGRVWGLVWLAALGCLVAAGVGIAFGQAWWPTLTLVGAAVSLVAIVPWWNTVVPGAKAGALFDLLILAALLLARDQILQWLS
ncbi:MAG: hypothetical protein PVH17_04930 [Anaerolineae bacterium]|jgi:hypothetical protein